MYQGTPLRAHLEKVEQATGKTPAELIFEEDPPEHLLYLLDWFWELHSGRQTGFSGPNPLSYNDIMGWRALFDIDITAWEIKALKAIDNVYMKVVRELQDEK